MFQYFDLPRIKKILSVLENSAVKEQYIYPKIMFAKGEYSAEQENSLQPFSSGQHWGSNDANAWFRVQYIVPQEFEFRPIWLEVYTGREEVKDIINPQMLVYVDGVEVQGIDRFHPCVCITQGEKAGKMITVDFDAWFGLAPECEQWTKAQSEACVFSVRAFIREQEVENLYWDIKTPCDVAALLPQEDSNRMRILKHLTNAVNLLDLRKVGSKAFFVSVQAAQKLLETEFYQKECEVNSNTKTAYVIGHTHIDVAWLWALEHTRKKASRSFATALALLEQYPDYQFMSSQPQLYEFVKKTHPRLYKRIKEAVEQNRWHPDGAMWLEADCNLASGESLIRQIVYGKRFFKTEFGVDSKVLWLPDVFGYSAALPQICKLCNVDYFMTTKISWNDTNQMPNDTFYWVGMDGSRILTHFIPTRDYECHELEGDTQTQTFTTYNGELSPNQVMGGWKRYASKDISDFFLICYGYGDGGGGTTRGMIEQHRRMEKGIPGCPRTLHISPAEFFEKLELQAKNNPRTPTWYGELYFEYHRGTYTSAAQTKRNNRKAEIALSLAEFACCLAMQTGVPLPFTCEQAMKQLQQAWTIALRNQFHDILPGSSISRVYKDSKKEYEVLFSKTEYLTDTALQCVLGCVENAGGILVCNSLGVSRGGLVVLPKNCMADALCDDKGNVFAVQCIKATKMQRICFVSNVPAMGYVLLKPSKQIKEQAVTITCTKNGEYTNNIITVQFNKNGQLVSVFDNRKSREIIPANSTANVLECYEDRPHAYDAWDLNVYHTQHKWEICAQNEPELIENGPVRAVFKVFYKWQSSTIVQHIIFYPNSSRIDFDTAVDWQEENIILKAAFPVDVFAQKATFDIQYGTVERPTHKNTSWDFAKFETCAHKWVDISEQDYGVSLLSESKYGFDVHEGVIRISLLRSAMYPAKNLDKGMQKFTYALYSHNGTWCNGKTQLEAYELNVPLYAVQSQNNEIAQISKQNYAKPLPQRYTVAACETEGVFMEILKLAEDGNGLIIRAFEGFGRRVNASFFLHSCSNVKQTNLLEEKANNELICENSNQFTACFHPYEIKTFRVLECS